MNKRRLQILLVTGATLFCCWSIYDFAKSVQRRDARSVLEQLSAGQNRLTASDPGLERADQFVRDLKAIDSRHAPADLTKAVSDYADAMQQGIDAARAHGDTKQADELISERKKVLMAAVEKYR